MKNCENCNQEHTGTFATGRFCCRKCANGFSTKAKRKEINAKVSNTLKGRIIGSRGWKGHHRETGLVKPLLNLKCPCCNIEFKQNTWRQKYCSNRSCHTQGRTWKVKDPSKMGGLRPGGGRSKMLEYTSPIAGDMKLNQEEIRVAKVLDTLRVKWSRNWNGFPYFKLDGSSRKYYPDFWLPELNCFLEYKGWVTSEMMHKMQTAKFPEGTKLVIVYSNGSRYKHLGLNLGQIEQDPTLLLRVINGGLAERPIAAVC